MGKCLRENINCENFLIKNNIIQKKKKKKDKRRKQPVGGPLGLNFFS